MTPVDSAPPPDRADDHDPNDLLEEIGRSYIEQTGRLMQCNAQLLSINAFVSEMKAKEEERDD